MMIPFLTHGASGSFFQRLDPVLRPAMDALKKAPLKTPLERFSLPFFKNGFLDDKGVLKYKYLGKRDSNPRDLTLVPHVLQIPVLLYFHKKNGVREKRLNCAKSLAVRLLQKHAHCF